MTKRNWSMLFANLLLILITQNLLADSIYPVEGSSAIYNEKRARRVGDVITVMIQENTQATQAASSQSQKSAGLVIGAGSGFIGSGLYGSNVLTNGTNNIGIGAGSSHQGQGTSSRGTTITGEMTAKIVSILPSGNYMIDGNRYVEINEEKQTIEVTGEIRPDDIASDNSVLSSRVANAKIKFTGTGPASETAKPGLITRVLGWLGLF